MPIEFQCPHCGHRTFVDDRYSGQTGPCAECRAAVTIPAISGAATGAQSVSSGGGAIVLIFLIVGAVAFLLCAGVGFFAFRLQSTVSNAQFSAATQYQCTANLKSLAVAMHNYHDQYKAFPPAYLADEDGKPMHSWRVLLLPYLGRPDLYDQYDFDEPWDGPNNSQLLSMIPSQFRCDEDYAGQYDQTSYLMIVGPEMFSDGPGARKMAEIKDGTSNTIMIVESHGAGIAWTEPRDLDAETMTFEICQGQPGDLNGHVVHSQAAFCDGSVHELPVGTPPEDLRAMATVAGGEVVSVP